MTDIIGTRKLRPAVRASWAIGHKNLIAQRVNEKKKPLYSIELFISASDLTANSINSNGMVKKNAKVILIRESVDYFFCFFFNKLTKNVFVLYGTYKLICIIYIIYHNV